MRAARGAWVTAATAAGFLAGWAVAKRVQHAHRAALFSRRAHRRRAALGWLEGHPLPEVAPLLRDYAAWEPEPALRLRAERLLRRLETTWP
ncbi:MAG TPA: hypothetical protein VJ773_07555 [Gemmatimonadales bacterium]|nr:hypothetical protein [Gemmatimonadales bacterium]